MLCLSTPAAPSLTRTFSQAASSVAGAYTLSIRLYQRPPLTPFSSADTMRSVQTEASTHDQSRASAPCVALAGTADALACSLPGIAHPPSCPPSLGAALLSALFAAHRRCSTMRALTPAASRQRDSSLRSIRWPSGHPVPNHVARPDVTCLSPRASDRSLAVPGFATHEQARRYVPPNRVRHPTGCPFASGCSPPRLGATPLLRPSATQLPSATYAVTSHGTDSHHADQTDCRTHSCAGLTRASIFFARKFLRRLDGLHRNSGLPEFRIIECRKPGKPDLRCQARQ